MMPGCFILSKKPFLVGHKITLQTTDKILIVNYFFSLKTGSTLLIIGNNGTGKTTLIKSILNNSIDPSFYFLWKDNSYKHVVDNFSLYHYFNPHQNLYLSPHLEVRPTIQYWSNYNLRMFKIFLESAFQKLSLWTIINKIYNNLSHGEKVRSILVQLILSPALIWMLDEPSNGLDLHYSNRLEELMKAHIQDGGIIFLITHHFLLIKNSSILHI